MTDIANILSLNDLGYAKFVGDFVDNMDPATRAHVAVAYQNFVPVISAIHQHNRQSGVAYTVEDFIRSYSETLGEPTDEINQRRRAWFFFAAVLARLEKLARTNTFAQGVGASVWTILATEYPRLKVLLPNSIVWSDEEKEWFELECSDQELIQLAVNHHIPPIFARHSIVEDFANALGLFYWPSKTRIGHIP